QIKPAPCWKSVDIVAVFVTDHLKVGLERGPYSTSGTRHGTPAGASMNIRSSLRVSTVVMNGPLVICEPLERVTPLSVTASIPRSARPPARSPLSGVMPLDLPRCRHDRTRKTGLDLSSKDPLGTFWYRRRLVAAHVRPA